MSACLLVGALVLTLPQADFTLEWEHSVEKIQWREQWRVEGPSLRLTGAAVKGSGSGMEPGEGAHLIDGWWSWVPELAPIPELALAASGATRGGWALCSAGQCQQIGASASDAVVLRPCE